jgi:hypothetical protein
MSEMWRFWGLVLLAIAIIIIISMILMKIFKKTKIVAIIPSLLVFVLSIILFIKGRFFSYAMEDLGYYIMSMIIFLAAIITLSTTLIILKIKENKK